MYVFIKIIYVANVYKEKVYMPKTHYISNEIICGKDLELPSKYNY